MREFELIARYLRPVAEQPPRAGVTLGMGDDCALLRLEPDQELAISMDTLVEGRHFPPNYPPEHVAWRALATAVSDLAAAGAAPLAFTLGLTLPAAEVRWLEAFAAGLAEASAAFDIALIGGDTTRGPLTLTVQVHGTVPAGQALTRSGACVGDQVCVTGTLGDAGEALRWLDKKDLDADQSWVCQRYHHPAPRLAVGQWLRGKASAAIDVSDGLMADLGHILKASGVGAVLDFESIPVSPALQALQGGDAKTLALQAGDDYELCFTWPGTAPLPAKIAGIPVSVIGVIESQPGLRLRRDQRVKNVQLEGYDHFQPGGIGPL